MVLSDRDDERELLAKVLLANSREERASAPTGSRQVRVSDLLALAANQLAIKVRDKERTVSPSQAKERTRRSLTS